MDMMSRVYEKASEKPQRVAFSEACEEKILLAVSKCLEKKLIVPVLVGKPQEIQAAAETYGVDLSGAEIFDTTDADAVEKMINDYLQLNAALSAKSLRRKTNADPIFTAMILLALGRVDCSFAGLVHTTGEVISAGHLIVGLKEGVKTPSSIGIFDIPGYEGSEGSLLAFGDSAVCTDPSAEDLASIAISACNTVCA